MMMQVSQKNKKVFSKILLDLEETVGNIDFALAFSSVELISFDDEKIVFGVPAEFFKEIIEKEHLEKMKEITIREVGIETLSVVVSDQKNAADFFEQKNQAPSETKRSVSHAKKTTDKKPVASSSSTTNKDYQENSLNHDFLFANFVVGSSNSFAHSVATVIAKNPGEAHNPCLIYGDVGLGKTHLLQAIGNDIKARFSKSKVLFYPSEKFLNAFTYAIANNKSREFKNKVRSADVLLLDDIHFFTNKPSLQEEFYHSFNALLGEKKQMVFASDRPIHQIRDLEERLKSRFRSNMIVDLQPPAPEMAMGILQNALKKNNVVDIDPKVIDFIVDRLRFNIRDMLGFVSRIVGYQNLTKTKVDLSIMKQWTLDYVPKKNTQRKNTSDKILSMVASYYNETISDLKSRKRNRSLTNIRHIAMYLLRELTNSSQTEVGDVFDVTHVSVSKAIVQISQRIETEADLLDEIEDLKVKIQQKEG